MTARQQLFTQPPSIEILPELALWFLIAVSATIIFFVGMSWLISFAFPEEIEES